MKVYATGWLAGGLEFREGPQRCYPSLEKAKQSFEAPTLQWVSDGPGIWVDTSGWPRPVILELELQSDAEPVAIFDVCPNCEVPLETLGTPTMDCPKCGKKYSADAEDYSGPGYLPDPVEMKRLMTQASGRVDDVLTKMRLLASEYGVHGPILTYGQYSFQLTRVNERWSIYIVGGSSPARDLQGAKLDEKLLFLDKAGDFQAEYAGRIRQIYATLKDISENVSPT